MPYYPKPLEKLINELRRLPGVGIKTAQRLAFHMMRMSQEELSALAEAIADLHSRLTYCSICGNITEIGRDPCDICSDPNRDHSLICVVEEPDDLLALERTGYK
ncbi:TPA: recombination protein RecR, partial [Candidatus Poribacteria bacterium]|nr:recombination protein RecR [Candidatus Poribacteria bacterium]